MTETKSWRCFHCDEVFTDEAEARDHFGRDEGQTPACCFPADYVRHIRELEQELSDERAENGRLENDARLWHEADEDRKRRIGNRQWWQEIDFREGEKIVLTEKLAEAEAEIAQLRQELGGQHGTSV